MAKTNSNTTNTYTTPMKAIRAYCIWCSGDSAAETKLCPSETCPLHAYRLGRVGDEKPIAGCGTPLKAIKARCYDCVGFSKSRVKSCDCDDCQLWDYRISTKADDVAEAE